jgi:HEAT repeat protein
MIVDGQDKLICDLGTDSCQLYDLAGDPAERKNLAGRSAKEAPLQARLRAFLDEEARFERGGAIDDKTRRALERGRLGDRGATRDLGALLARGADDETRREAARLLAVLPPDRAVRPMLEEASRDSDRMVARAAQVALTRIGDKEARSRVLGFVAAACGEGAGADGPLCARAALALGDPAWLARGLEVVSIDDQALKVELVRALGATHDPRALAPLMVALADVRARVEVISALGALGDSGALPTLFRWLPAEPYIPARAAMVGVMVDLSRAPAERTQAKEVISTLLAGEKEPEVKSACEHALARLQATEAKSQSR